MVKGQRLQIREGHEDRRLEQSLRADAQQIYQAVEEIGRWVFGDKAGQEPVGAFQICRAYYRSRPNALHPNKRKKPARRVADILEIAAKLSRDRRAQAKLGIKERKGRVSDQSILKVSCLLYHGKPLGDVVTDEEIQTERRHWDNCREELLRWAEELPYTFSAEMRLKAFVEHRLGREFSWREYMTRSGG